MPPPAAANRTSAATLPTATVAATAVATSVAWTARAPGRDNRVPPAHSILPNPARAVPGLRRE